MWTHLSSIWDYRSSRLANWNFPVPNLSAVRMAVGIWCCGAPSCLSCQLLVLGKLKPLETLSPPCCKAAWIFVVFKLALQASSESCRKIVVFLGIFLVVLTCFSVFRIWKLNKIFHTSGEFMAPECSGIIDNELNKSWSQPMAAQILHHAWPIIFTN